MHLSALLVFWALLTLLILSPLPKEVIENDYCDTILHMPSTVWTIGLCSCALYCTFFRVLHHVLPGVSVPGGPRRHKIRRTPVWDDKAWERPAALDQWRCVTAQEAHDVSTADFVGTHAVLTGEPAGRDLWTTTAKPLTNPNYSNASSNTDVPTSVVVDENLVTELAASGRPRGGGGEFNPARNPNSADLPFREQMIRGYLSRGNAPPSLEKATTTKEVIQKAVHFYSMLQSEDGHWAGDYGGPHFLLPGLIIAWYVMGRPASMFQQEAIDLMIAYIFRHQQSDGGWGTHLESPSTMFGTTLMYVAIRCLGVDKDHPVCVRGRRFIQDQGGAVMTSSWAKFYLCILGAMEWEGHNVVPAEMWLLPNWCPFHPGRMWCHARMVYRKCKHWGSCRALRLFGIE